MTCCTSFSRENSALLALCSHRIVDRPLTASNAPATDEMLDKFGLETLRVPVHVCKPRDVADKEGRPCQAVDVVFAPCVTTRALRPPPAVPNFQQRTIQVAMKEVTKELGIKFGPQYRVLTSNYKGATEDKRPMAFEVEPPDDWLPAGAAGAGKENKVPSDFLHAREAEPEPALKDLKLRPEAAENPGLCARPRAI